MQRSYLMKGKQRANFCRLTLWSMGNGASKSCVNMRENRRRYCYGRSLPFNKAGNQPWFAWSQTPSNLETGPESSASGPSLLAVRRLFSLAFPLGTSLGTQYLAAPGGD